MFGAIQRVISGGDVASQVPTTEADRENSGIKKNDRIPTSSVDIRPSASIENDCSMHTPSSSLSDMSIPRREQETARTASPALSKSPAISHIIPIVASDAMIMEVDDSVHLQERILLQRQDRSQISMQTQPQGQMYAPNNSPMFVRKDSRFSSDSSSATSIKAASSQNSSRDWGWFEDVHESQNNLSLSSNHRRKSNNNGNKKKARLVPSAEITSSSSEGLVESILQKQKSHHTGMFAVELTV